MWPAKACKKASLLEDISLPEQKVGEGFFNLMTIEDGLNALCSLKTIDKSLFEEARRRLDIQDKLVDILLRDGVLKPSGARYYRGFFDEVEENIAACEAESLALRSSQKLPELEKLVQLNIRANDIIDIFYLESSTRRRLKHIISHKTWYGRIIAQDGFNLCQTELISL